MSDLTPEGPRTLAGRARDAATLVVGQAWPGEDFASVEAKLSCQPVRVQAEVTLGVLGYLALLALFAGQFGPLGLMAYLGAVLVAVR